MNANKKSTINTVINNYFRNLGQKTLKKISVHLRSFIPHVLRFTLQAALRAFKTLLRFSAFSFSILLILISNSSYAEKLNPPDLEIGEEINETCAGCHGEYAEGGKGGEYPRLAGLPASYIINQLHLFRDRIRPNIPMLEYLDKGQLPDQEIVDVAAYMEKIQLVTKLPPLIEGDEFDAYERMMMTKTLLNIPKLEGNIKAGKKLYKKECKTCHGRKGEGKVKKGAPMLTGQYTQYLKRQVKLFIDKKRIHDKDAPDEELLSLFTDMQLHDVFSYLSILDDK
jgi:cytochrome c553